MHGNSVVNGAHTPSSLYYNLIQTTAIAEALKMLLMRMICYYYYNYFVVITRIINVNLYGFNKNTATRRIILNLMNYSVYRSSCPWSYTRVMYIVLLQTTKYRLLI